MVSDQGSDSETTATYTRSGGRTQVLIDTPSNNVRVRVGNTQRGQVSTVHESPTPTRRRAVERQASSATVLNSALRTPKAESPAPRTLRVARPEAQPASGVLEGTPPVSYPPDDVEVGKYKNGDRWRWYIVYKGSTTTKGIYNTWQSVAEVTPKEGFAGVRGFEYWNHVYEAWNVLVEHNWSMKSLTSDMLTPGNPWASPPQDFPFPFIPGNNGLM